MTQSRFAFEKASRVLRDKLPQAARPAQAELEPVLARNTPRQPIPRAALIRQTQSRWFSSQPTFKSNVRSFSSKPRGQPLRSALPKSRTGAAVKKLTSRAPFASTLRPNLTGGTFCRTAGGYGTGAGRVGGARYFSHAPASQAQVVNNVSAAVRAFWISGQKAQFDGIDPRSGEKRYKAVSELQEKTGRTLRSVPKASPGSYIDFCISPTVTAFGSFSSVPRYTKAVSVHQESLNSEGLIDLLSVDFARALKDLALTMKDLKRLAVLGDLPLSMPDKSTLRVRLPGCDLRTVERLCDEFGIQRGVIRQDEDFDERNGTEIALLFPFAPSRAPSEFAESSWLGPAKQTDPEELNWRGMMSPTSSPGFSKRSDAGIDFENIESVGKNPWISSSSGYSSLHESDADDAAMYFSTGRSAGPVSQDYEGLEGIYKFLEECDAAKR